MVYLCRALPDISTKHNRTNLITQNIST